MTTKAATSRQGSPSILGFIRRYSVFLILALLCIFFALQSDQFLTVSNLTNVALQTSLIAVVAIGMTFVMLTGGIDLSVGSVVALTGALAAGLAVRQGLGTWPAILLALSAGMAAGAVNGLLIVKGKMPPFVATLAMMAVARGLTLVYTEGRPIAGIDDAFIAIGNGTVLGIPNPVIIMFVVFLIAYLLFS